MKYKKGKLFKLSIILLALSGCSSNYNFVGISTTNEENESNSVKKANHCEEVDPLNTSYLSSGAAWLATLNPVTSVIIGGVTYLVVDNTSSSCQSVDKNSNKPLNQDK